MAFCKANGINIHYIRTGGKKPILVLLHGLAANGSCWTEVAHFLEKECDIIMPDARGHGESSIPKYGYTYDDHANDIIYLIENLGLPPLFLLGHSMGGMTSAKIASCYPQLLRGLILADPTFLSTRAQHQIQESDVRDQHRLLLGKSLQELTADLQSKHPNRSQDIIRLIARARLQTNLKAFDILTPPNPDYKQLVRAIKIPSLLIYADNGVVSDSVAEEIRYLNPVFEVDKIPDAGHGLHFDKPERFASMVLTFINSHDL